MTLMKLHFRDQTFSFELLRTASYGMYGGSEIGEVLATAHRINEGDFESWHLEWSHLTKRIETLANTSLQAVTASAGSKDSCARVITFAPRNSFSRPMTRAEWQRARIMLEQEGSRNETA